MYGGCILKNGEYIAWCGGYMDTVRMAAWLYTEANHVRVTRLNYPDEIYPDIDTAIAATILKLS